MAKVAGVALAAVMACGVAGEAQAYYVLYGDITSRSADSGLIPSNVFRLGGTIKITAGVQPNYTAGLNFTDLYNSAVDIQFVSGNNSFFGIPARPEPSYIENDGSSSSIVLYDSFDSGYFSSSQSEYGVGDGGSGLNVTSSLPNIPTNPEQSFGPIGISGTGGFGSNVFVFSGDGVVEGYLQVGFELRTIEGIGDLSPVPLPASAPMFGAALLCLAGLGYATKRKRAA